MSSMSLKKLDWPQLIEQLASFCQTQDGKHLIYSLKPNLSKDEVIKRWDKVEPLVGLIANNYTPPFEELESYHELFRLSQLGQLLDGKMIQKINIFLQSVNKIYLFCKDFSNQCSTLEYIQKHIDPLHPLAQNIKNSIDEEGLLVDSASKKLKHLRKQKQELSKQVQKHLQSMFQNDSDVNQYLQDQFFTVRSERYVIPIRTDGHGRVKGRVIDTSTTEQTLFIEPASISTLNDELVELDVEEKIEVLRIFRELSDSIRSHLGSLEKTYHHIIELDFLSAQARLAIKTKGRRVELQDTPLVDLKNARHPLLYLKEPKNTIGNHITLDGNYRSLIISGPNAGGKTIILKTVGLIQTMVQSGLLAPVDKNSKLFLFHRVFIEIGDAQNITANLSTFSGHLKSMKPILDSCDSRDLVLLDELAIGTEPQTAAALAQAILEFLADKEATTLVTTHFDVLKALPINDPRFRNGAMEFSFKEMSATFQLLLDVPGQSYGLELAKQLNFHNKILERAEQLKGQDISSLDKAVHQIMETKAQFEEKQKDLETEAFRLQTAKRHWEEEKKLLHSKRAQTLKNLAEAHEKKLNKMEEQYHEILEDYKSLRKNLSSLEDLEELKNKKSQLNRNLSDLSQAITSTGSQKSPEKLPGKEVNFSQLELGDQVYVRGLNKQGTITKIGSNPRDPLEVEVGVIKVKITVAKLRLIGKNKKIAKTPKRKITSTSNTPHPTTLLQTSTNTCDLRGQRVHEATSNMWKFIDSAILRGEPGVMIIHGHGEQELLKKSLRAALAHKPLYPLSFRGGLPQDGGDGITLIFFKN